MRRNKVEKIYRSLPIISLVILVICFIFRYSYINILGFDRPLKLAVLFCTSFGVIGALLAMVDGVNKDFRGKVVLFFIINLIFIFTFPLLHAAEFYLKPVENPYENLVPETEYTTKKRSDAAFILEGELYQWPLSLDEFIANGYDYRQIDPNTVSLSKRGKSMEVKPTWFTDGSYDGKVIEAYNIELSLGKDQKDVKAIAIKSLENNWDFEVLGFTLLDSIGKVNAKFKDKLIEDPNNNKTTVKTYYLDTEDGYKITFGAIKGKIQSVEIRKK